MSVILECVLLVDDFKFVCEVFVGWYCILRYFCYVIYLSGVLLMDFMLVYGCVFVLNEIVDFDFYNIICVDFDKWFWILFIDEYYFFLYF